MHHSEDCWNLNAVRIPRVLRGFDDAGADGDALFDLRIDGARIAAIEPSPSRQPRGTLLSAPVEAHAHIDKNYSVQEVGAACGDLFSAITRTQAHHAHWTAAHLAPRMERALREAWQSGTRALRTHLDWVQAAPPPALAVAQALRDQWQGRVDLQFVSLTPLDLFADAVAGETIARAVAAAGGVLGAFVYRNADLADKLVRVFALAERHGLALDFHVDEGLDADAQGLAEIARLTLAHGLAGRVVCGHACSLAVQDDVLAARTLALCAQAGLHLVALPTTNLYLQGAWDRTPVPRGITRLREAAAHGLRPILATDNVQDAFYPYGGYDLIDIFALGVQVAHLAPAEDWLDTITVNPARALGLDWDGRLATGAPADLLLLAATGEHEIIGPAARRRTVIRAGRKLEESL